MQQIKFGFLTLLIIAAVGTFAYTATHPKESHTVHLHAAFRVYVDGVAIDFSGIQYMNIKPCDTEGHTAQVESAEEEQIEKAHLHDGVGDVVHVHREHATWGNLFQNLHYTFDRPVIGLRVGSDPINPEAVTFDTEITAYDRVYFVVGDATDLVFPEELVPSVDRIKEVEAMSETCGT